MITTIVQFSLPQPMTHEAAREKFSSTAPKYTDIPGLIRKYYLLSEDGQVAGGVYLWKSRDRAEQFYTDEWKQFIKDLYGAEPSMQFFASPVVVDNSSGEILKDG